VFVAFGTMLDVKSALNVTLSVSPSPRVMFPSAVILPVAWTLPVTWIPLVSVVNFVLPPNCRFTPLVESIFKFPVPSCLMIELEASWYSLSHRLYPS
jgi:hypothetical protein